MAGSSTSALRLESTPGAVLPLVDEARLGVNQDCWLLENPWQFVLCRHVNVRSAPILQVLLATSLDKSRRTAVYQRW
jgi:hypothetical protein